MTTTTEYRTKGDVTVRYVEGTEDGIDFDAAYSVTGYGGVAWRLQGWKQDWRQNETWWQDEDGSWYAEDTDGGEPVDDRSMIVAVMVGDDRFFVFDRDEVAVIPEEDFCHSCGQIGCTAEVWD